MITNNEAVENFLAGKRNLAAFQFCQLIKETNSDNNKNHQATTTTTTTTTNVIANNINNYDESLVRNLSSLSIGSTSAVTSQSSITVSNKSTSLRAQRKTRKKQVNEDELAFNYAMVNLFTGCPRRASIIFSDLLKRYPRNPRLWLRLAESMLAAERARLSEFEHIQQISNPNSRDHLIKTKNRPILIKINPNYCHQQLLQQQQSQVTSSRLPANFLVIIKSYLKKSLDLIIEYNDISLLNDDIPQQQNQGQTASNNCSVRASRLSTQLSYANPYKSISRSALYHLRNKVQLNLAYVCLCMGEPVQALEYTTLCLKLSPQGYEKIMASLYHAEACILASRVDEAIQFLNLEILNMAKSLQQDHPLVLGDTKGIVYGDEMQHQCDRGTLATIITYNLSVAYAAKGEFNNAYKILMRCVQPTKPNPMQLIICLLYVQLQLGQVDAAKRIIMNSLPQFR